MQHEPVPLRADASRAPAASDKRDSGHRPSLAVAADGVQHTYATPHGGTLRALDDVSFTLEPGRFASLIGPSGCGKSTLLKIVGGLIRQSAGTVRVGDREVTGPQQQIGYMFQDATLLPWRTAVDNVLLPIEVRQGKNAAKRHRPKALELLRTAEIGDFADAYPDELSGGMAQRVAICRMLVTGPRLLLLDEPFGALDELTRESMNMELQRVCLEEEATTVMVTHSIPEAVFLGDRVFVMSKRPATISHVVEVDLPRPRTFDLTTEPTFGNVVSAVRRALNEGS